MATKSKLQKNEIQINFSIYSIMCNINRLSKVKRCRWLLSSCPGPSSKRWGRARKTKRYIQIQPRNHLK